MMQSYVIIEVDPTYRESHVVAVFDSEDAAFDARKITESRLSESMKDRGVYHKITVFETNNVYRA